MANDIQVEAGARTLIPHSTFTGWYDPTTPIPAIAPAGTQPRQFDYPLTRNQDWLPRAGEKIGFPQLRMMADGCYLVRVIIEKMKDRIATKQWHLRLKPQAGEYQAQTKERSNKDPRVAALSKFFEWPDQVHPWDQWLRMLLEDRLVVDAATLEVQRTRGGGIYNLLPIDGATINVLIDVTGRRPAPPLPAYRQIVKGLPAVDFVSGVPTGNLGQLIYMPANVRNHKLYGYSPVEQTLAIILTLIYKTVHHQNFYDESNIPMAYIQLPESMSTSEMLRLTREIEASLSGQLEQRSKLLPVSGNGKIEILKVEPFNALFEEWCARIFTFVLGETATPFTKSNNRATAQQSDDTREESGEKPLMNWVKGSIDGIIQRPDLFNGGDIEFVWDEEAETDSLKQAQVDQINVSIGSRTADELRQRDGLSSLWEDSGGNPPLPSMNVEQETEHDEPGDGGGNDDGGKPKPKPKPKTDGGKAAKAVVEDIKKKSLHRY